jgi:hypothetical protein
MPIFHLPKKPRKNTAVYGSNKTNLLLMEALFLNVLFPMEQNFYFIKKMNGKETRLTFEV